MEEHQEFEKPVFEFHHKKFRRSSRVLRIRTKKSRVGESMNQYEELSCYYGMRENPKKNTKKSTLDHRLGTRRRNKKSLIRCEECGKGFRYEKCLSNHRQVMHSLNQKKTLSEESMRMSLLCSFGVVQRRKRSKRVFRYKKIPRFSVDDDEESLEAAESLILLSKSGGKFLNCLTLVGEALDSNLRGFENGSLRNEQKLVGEALDGEFTDGVLSNKQKLVGISTESGGTSKELSGFLGDKKAIENDELGQQKQVGAGILRAEVGLERVSLEDWPGLMLQNAETDIDQKLGCQETAFRDSNSGFEINIEHRCGICDKAFSTYQALGGHQTFHRMKKKSKSQSQRCRKESVEAEAEINGSVTLTHKCRVGSRLTKSVQVLRGHKKCHRTRTYNGETFDVSLVTSRLELEY